MRTFTFSRVTAPLLALLLVLTAATAHAYDIYSQNGGDATNCGACHGDFRSSSYVSNTDGTNWGSLHDLHQDALGGDCSTCHSSGPRFPVLLDSSSGGSGLAAISCMGCHGREEDNTAANPSFPFGRGAGLRQHHTVSGTATCIGCHADADPINYTPVTESVAPEYYVNPGSGHPGIPTGPCNDDGSENFAGAAEGTDNDGDGVYDTFDSDCGITDVPDISGPWNVTLEAVPNPFRSDTAIRYSLGRSGPATVSVYDVAGRLVRALVNAPHSGTSTFETHWNGTGAEGTELAAGVYVIVLETQGITRSRRVILLR